MELLKTTKGHDKLSYGGYAYNCNRQVEERKYWRCELRATCNGRMTTNLQCTNLEAAPSQHSHAPNPARIEALKALKSITDRALTSDDSSVAIINNAIAQVPLTAAGAIPRKDSLARLVRRKRTAPDGDEVPDSVRTTTRGEEFVSLEEDDLVIFTTVNNLNILHHNRNWFADGTFDTAPLGRQLYTIHVALHESSTTVPLVYCISGKRDEELYDRIFNHLKEKRPDLDPISLTMDFEMAAINSMMRAFPNVNIYGCYFHFTQASFRKLQGLGLQAWYQQSPDHAHLIKKFQVRYKRLHFMMVYTWKHVTNYMV